MENKKNKINFDTSEVTKMLQRKRLLNEVDEAFEEQTEEYQRNLEKLKMKEETIKGTDYKIQEKFIKHCKFLADNKEKRDRAQRHLEEEQKLKEKKMQEIALEEETINQLEEQKAFLEEKISKMSCYEDFLNKVVEKNPEQYKDINDLVQRFQILQSSNKNFKAQKEELEEQLKDLQSEKAAIEKTQGHEIMLLNNEITSLQKTLEEAESSNNRLNEEIKSEEENTHSKMESLAKIILAIDNLYDLSKSTGIRAQINNDKSRKKTKKETPEELEEKKYKYNIEEIMEKMQTIQNTTECMKAIVDMHNKKEVKNK